MESELTDYECKEICEVINRIPLEITSKIPFDVRNKLAEKADKCNEKIPEIDFTKELNEMNISDNSKKFIFSLYAKYLSGNEIKAKLDKYSQFCQKHNSNGGENK